ncbi:MAG: FMN-binding protein [Clostridiales bacterium]|jgi:major membrane immunogen (membrane-anchored lipoprotein)|nr:FMN-binding protein [Clostridiales bacterium]
MKKVIFWTLSLALLFVTLTGCGGASYSDGTYMGISSEDEEGAYGEVTITIKDSKITDCQFVTWQRDGSIKDEEYGKVNGEISNQDYYDKAQFAVAAMKQYAEGLVAPGSLDDIDAISGATIAYDQFTEAVKDALTQAKKSG